MVDDGVVIGCLVLGKLFLEFFDVLSKWVCGLGLHPMQQLSGVEPVLAFCYFFVVRADHYQ